MAIVAVEEYYSYNASNNGAVVSNLSVSMLVTEGASAPTV